MSELVILVMVLVAAAILVKALQPGAKVVEHKYQKKKLVSQGERAFLKVLMDATSGEHLVFAKVRVADLISPVRGLSSSEWQKAFNRISAKHVDFVLCSRDGVEVLAALELDDKSHNSRKVVARDALLNKAFESARLPLIRFQASNSYDPGVIQRKIASELVASEPTAKQ